jgi:hypothetical protein
MQLPWQMFNQPMNIELTVWQDQVRCSDNTLKKRRHGDVNNRRLTLSMALIALICFFLPWVHLSCGASENRLSGVDIARDGHTGLWLIPLLMLAVLFIATARAWKNRREFSALVCLLAGLVSAYLMNRERMRAEDTSGLISVGLTGWFWLGLCSTIGLVVLSAFRFLKRSRAS